MRGSRFSLKIPTKIHTCIVRAHKVHLQEWSTSPRSVGSFSFEIVIVVTMDISSTSSAEQNRDDGDDDDDAMVRGHK